MGNKPIQFIKENTTQLQYDLHRKKAVIWFNNLKVIFSAKTCLKVNSQIWRRPCVYRWLRCGCHSWFLSLTLNDWESSSQCNIHQWLLLVAQSEMLLLHPSDYWLMISRCWSWMGVCFTFTRHMYKPQFLLPVLSPTLVLFFDAACRSSSCPLA